MHQPALARILIVDDEESLMKALSTTLQERGYQTAGFTQGPAALDTMRQNKFDLLLSDITMPGMDGIALLRAALELDPNLVGIMMTGQGTIATAVEAMKCGAFDYILKPFKLSFILPVLSRALALRQLRLENAALQRRIHERTLELEAANKDLEAFSYSISHDLRAPLRAVDGFATILSRKYSAQMPEDARRLLNQVTTSAQRMGQLIDDLLRFSRLGRESLSKRPTNISGIVQSVLEELRKDHSGRKIDVRVESLPDCNGDSALLRQAFVNLLSNAFKYTRQRENAVIEVGCRRETGENVYFVRDNGAGFDMQYAEKLFGVFQRFHRAEEFEGTGVGLSIVQRIIQRHDGRVWAESTVGKGAAFYFTLESANRCQP